MKNYLIRVLVLLWIIIGILWLLSFLPSSSLLKPVNLLSDILPAEKVTDSPEIADVTSDNLAEELDMIDAEYSDEAEEAIDSTNTSSVQDTVINKLPEPWETNRILDYATASNGLKSFYKRLNKIQSLNRPLRIAILGDSYFSTDAFSASLRENLQVLYGGTGVGYISVTPTNKRGYRPTVYHLCKGWYRYEGSRSSTADNQGLAGYYFKPVAPDAEVFVYGLKEYSRRIGKSKRFSLYFTNKSPLQLGVSINNNEQKVYDIPPRKGLNKLVIDAEIDTVRWTVLHADSTLFYGMAMDDVSGVCVDDLSKENASGSYLRTIPDWFLNDFNKERPYDLVILQYGSYLKATDKLDKYKQDMTEALTALKKNMPHTTFMLLGAGSQATGDRRGRVTPKMGMDKVLRCQQRIAEDNKIAFWNMYYAMGGEQGMQKMIRSRDALLLPSGKSGRLNQYGSIKVAKLLLNALKESQTEYGDNTK